MVSQTAHNIIDNFCHSSYRLNGVQILSIWNYWTVTDGASYCCLYHRIKLSFYARQFCFKIWKAVKRSTCRAINFVLIWKKPFSNSFSQQISWESFWETLKQSKSGNLKSGRNITSMLLINSETEVEEGHPSIYCSS